MTSLTNSPGARPGGRGSQTSSANYLVNVQVSRVLGMQNLALLRLSSCKPKEGLSNPACFCVESRGKSYTIYAVVRGSLVAINGDHLEEVRRGGSHSRLTCKRPTHCVDSLRNVSIRRGTRRRDDRGHRIRLGARCRLLGIEIWRRAIVSLLFQRGKGTNARQFSFSHTFLMI